MQKMHIALTSAAVMAGIAAGYVAGVAQHDSAASIRAQTRAEVRSAICQALDRAELDPPYRIEEPGATVYDMLTHTSIAGSFGADLSTAQGCRSLWQ